MAFVNEFTVHPALKHSGLFEQIQELGKLITP